MPYVLMVLLLVLIAGGLLKSYISPFNKAKFNSRIWKDSKPRFMHNECIRGRMLSDAESEVLVSGQSKADVLAALGTPEVDEGSKISYNIGGCTGAYTGDDFLDIYFDQKDNLKKSEVYSPE